MVMEYFLIFVIINTQLNVFVYLFITELMSSLPCHDPSKLVGVLHSGHRNASELSDCHHVRSWNNNNNKKKFYIKNFDKVVLIVSLLSLTSYVPRPGVDQESLSRSRGAANHHLSQQYCIFGDRQRMEVSLQRQFLAGSVQVIDLIHYTLKEELG